MRALAIGLVVATGLALAIPASAEELRIGVPGVGVEIGSHRDRDRDDVRIRTDGYERSRGDRGDRCTTTTIRSDDGSVKRIRRCRD